MLNCVAAPSFAMNDMKRYAFHILRIQQNYMEHNQLCKLNRRARRRITPYYVPGSGRWVLVENEKIHERTHRKSENSDTGNENEDSKDCERFVSSDGLFKSKSLENINFSSHNFNCTQDFLIELENRRNAAESCDVELVSSKMKCLNV